MRGEEAGAKAIGPVRYSAWLKPCPDTRLGLGGYSAWLKPCPDTGLEGATVRRAWPAGPPGAVPEPEEKADEGVGRGPGGPPHWRLVQLAGGFVFADEGERAGAKALALPRFSAWLKPCPDTKLAPGGYSAWLKPSGKARTSCPDTKLELGGGSSAPGSTEPAAAARGCDTRQERVSGAGA